MRTYYIEYVSNDYPYQVKTAKKNVKSICEDIIKEGGTIVNVSYPIISGYETINVDVNWKYV